MKYQNRAYLRFFIILFTLSISVTEMPCGLMLTHGLFGEVKTATATAESRTDREELSARQRADNIVKGENRYNIWFEIAPVLIFLVYLKYGLRLPRGETIVTLKVRMDN